MVLSFFGQNGGPPAPPPELAQLRAYWQALRDGSALPARASINPRGISGILEKTLLIERVAPGVARLRIAGMAVRDLVQDEVVGMPLSVLFEPAARAPLSEALEAVFAGPCAVEMDLHADRGIGRPALSGRMLMLPLTGNGGAVDMAIGCLCLTGEPGRAPRRLSMGRVVKESLAPAPAKPRQSELAEDPAPFTPKPGRSERPYLRLVKSS